MRLLEAFARPKPPEVVPVPPEELPSHYKQAQIVRAREARREKRYGNAKTAAVLGLACYAAFLTYRNEQALDLAAQNANRVIYTALRDDGTLVSTAMYSSLPPQFQADNRLNSLWYYVFWRECYSAAEAPRAHYNVQRMSSDRVRREWVDFISPSNPQSPQNTLGKRGAYYQCDPVSYTPVGKDDDRYTFRFMRYEVDARGKRDRGVLMFAPIAFHTGIYPQDADAWKDRTVFNAAGVQVWEYRGAQPEALQPHLQRRVAEARQ